MYVVLSRTIIKTEREFKLIIHELAPIARPIIDNDVVGVEGTEASSTIRSGKRLIRHRIPLKRSISYEHCYDKITGKYMYSYISENVSCKPRHANVFKNAYTSNPNITIVQFKKTICRKIRKMRDLHLLEVEKILYDSEQSRKSM